MKTFRTIAVATALMGLSATTALAEDAVGKWTGTVKASEGLIPVSVTFTKAPNGTLTGVSQSPKKGGGAPLKVEKIVTDGKTLSFAVPAADGDFKGEWQAEKKSWVGRWAAQDGPLDMVLTRAK
jgi:hypothetical protein